MVATEEAEIVRVKAMQMYFCEKLLKKINSTQLRDMSLNTFK
jgi:hypothetical protein